MYDISAFDTENSGAGKKSKQTVKQRVNLERNYTTFHKAH